MTKIKRNAIVTSATGGNNPIDKSKLRRAGLTVSGGANTWYVYADTKADLVKKLKSVSGKLTKGYRVTITPPKGNPRKEKTTKFDLKMKR